MWKYNILIQIGQLVLYRSYQPVGHRQVKQRHAVHVLQYSDWRQTFSYATHSLISTLLSLLSSKGFIFLCPTIWPSSDEKQRWWLVYSTGSARVSDILWDPLMCVAPTPGFLLSGNCILSVSTADKWSRKGAAHCHRPVLYNTMACIVSAVCGFIWCCWPVNVHMHSIHTQFLTTKYFRQTFSLTFLSQN